MSEALLRYFWWWLFALIALCNLAHWLHGKLYLPKVRRRNRLIRQEPFRDDRDGLQTFKRMYPRD